MKHVPLEADVGDIILLHKHSIHCSLPNRSNDFRISADLRYNVAGQPSGREPLPNFYVRSKNKNNIKLNLETDICLSPVPSYHFIPFQESFEQVFELCEKMSGM